MAYRLCMMSPAARAPKIIETLHRWMSRVSRMMMMMHIGYLLEHSTHAVLPGHPASSDGQQT